MLYEVITDTQVTLEAYPDPSSMFAGWTGPGVACGSSPVCVVTMDQAKTVTATFDNAMQQLDILRDGTGIGEVMSTVPDNP